MPNINAYTDSQIQKAGDKLTAIYQDLQEELSLVDEVSKQAGRLSSSLEKAQKNIRKQCDRLLAEMRKYEDGAQDPEEYAIDLDNIAGSMDEAIRRGSGGGKGSPGLNPYRRTFGRTWKRWPVGCPTSALAR
jgi:predicted ribosome quality control (RQC) complex YloA/Tae2 family protein